MSYEIQIVQFWDSAYESNALIFAFKIGIARYRENGKVHANKSRV